MTRTETITLPDALNIASVAELYPLLNEALESGGAVTLQADATGRVDAAGVQLLVAFVLEAAARQITVTVVPPGSPLIEAVRDLGLESSIAPALIS